MFFISIFFISACDIYNTLYIKEGVETVEVPEGDIIMEGIDAEEEFEEWEDIDIVEITTIKFCEAKFLHNLAYIFDKLYLASSELSFLKVSNNKISLNWSPP